MLVRFPHPSNAVLQITDTPAGILILPSNPHSANASSPMVPIPDGMTMLLRLSQLKKVLWGSVVILAEKSTLDKLLKLENTPTPMLVTLEGTDTLTMLEHPENAY